MTLGEILANFHFVRPGWFYALIPAVLLFTVLRWRQSHHSNWERAIDLHLLPHLLDNPDKAVSKSPLTLMLAAWIIAVLALAGPVWQKKPQPIHEREDALVVLFDLTRSMLATDVKPNRLVRAKRKLIDLLGLREEGETALVVFAGDAHTVSPLTDDANTIMSLIPPLQPGLVPAPGSRLAPALQLAIQLFEDGGASSGRILIITDEIRDLVASQRVARQYRNRYPVSVLSVGTVEGAPVPFVRDGRTLGNLKDASGRLVVARLNPRGLEDFARLAGGRYAHATLADEDLGYLLADQPLLEDSQYRELERDYDIWLEQGPWLLLLLLPLAALAFRRGWLWCLPLLLLVQPQPAQASFWDDLWQTRDQQGMAALDEQDPLGAATLFEHQGWRATANYRGEDYETAANEFAQIDSTDGRYNLGNALAKQGKFEEAIEAYEQALDMDPGNEDAAFNKALIEEMLEQQQQQQQQQEQEGEGGDEQEQEQEQSQQQQSEEEEQQQQQQQQQGDEQQEEGEDEQQQAQQQGEEGEEEEKQDEQGSEEEALLEEERQALQQWLRRVPDDPGGLLIRKFQQQHEERKKQGKGQNDTTADW